MGKSSIADFLEWLKSLFGGKNRAENWQEAAPLKADRVEDLKAQGHVSPDATYIWVSGKGVDRRMAEKTHAIAWVEDPDTRTRRKVVDSAGCILMVELPKDAL